LPVSIGIGHRRPAEPLERAVGKSPGRNAVVTENLVVQCEVVGWTGSGPHQRRGGGVQSQLGLVDLNLGIVGQHTGQRVVRTAFGKQCHPIVMEFDIDPETPPLGIAGG